MEKEHNQYGPEIQNNAEVFQGAAISAFLFSIYLGDMMDDNNALSDRKLITNKHAPGRCERELWLHVAQLIKDDILIRPKHKLGGNGSEPLSRNRKPLAKSTRLKTAYIPLTTNSRSHQ